MNFYSSFVPVMEGAAFNRNSAKRTDFAFIALYLQTKVEVQHED